MHLNLTSLVKDTAIFIRLSLAARIRPSVQSNHVARHLVIAQKYHIMFNLE